MISESVSVRNETGRARYYGWKIVGTLSLTGGANAIVTIMRDGTGTLTFENFGARASGATLMFTESDTGVTPPPGFTSNGLLRSFFAIGPGS